MLLRLAYLGITNAVALLRLLPGSDRDKDAEILALRHQLAVLQRQLGEQRIRFDRADRTWLAALLHQLPRPTLRHLRLLVRPDTVLRWHRDLVARRHAAVSRPRRRGRPPTVRSIRTLVLRLVAENASWGYRRVHGELLALGIKVAASTVWEMLREAGIDPAPDRASSTWTQFLRSQAEALLAADFIETVTLAGMRMYVLAVIEHASRRVRILGATAHPTAAWVVQAARNLVMDLEGVGCRVKYLIRDRDGKYPPLFDTILADASITIVRSGACMPRMNAVMERWVQTCRRELLDRTLIWNQRHLLHALREYEIFYNAHRPHQGIANARPLAPLPEPIADTARLLHLTVHRRDRLGGVLHEYEHAARSARMTLSAGTRPTAARCSAALTWRTTRSYWWVPPRSINIRAPSTRSIRQRPGMSAARSAVRSTCVHGPCPVSRLDMAIPANTAPPRSSALVQRGSGRLGRAAPVFFVLEVASRYVHILGVTAHPDGPWTARQARDLLMDLGDGPSSSHS
jgi:transposase